MSLHPIESELLENVRQSRSISKNKKTAVYKRKLHEDFETLRRQENIDPAEKAMVFLKIYESYFFDEWENKSMKKYIWKELCKKENLGYYIHMVEEFFGYNPGKILWNYEMFQTSMELICGIYESCKDFNDDEIEKTVKMIDKLIFENTLHKYIDWIDFYNECENNEDEVIGGLSIGKKEGFLLYHLFVMQISSIIKNVILEQTHKPNLNKEHDLSFLEYVYVDLFREDPDLTQEQWVQIIDTCLENLIPELYDPKLLEYALPNSNAIPDLIMSFPVLTDEPGFYDVSPQLKIFSYLTSFGKTKNEIEIGVFGLTNMLESIRFGKQAELVLIENGPFIFDVLEKHKRYLIELMVGEEKRNQHIKDKTQGFINCENGWVDLYNKIDAIITKIDKKAIATSENQIKPPNFNKNRKGR
ncbi:hypothetical protein KO465_06630 [Candidatus Micrarchaeota archaeon]|nr:hypothetical protein [Candidatus Micrarchaeota archaeon]